MFIHGEPHFLYFVLFFPSFKFLFAKNQILKKNIKCYQKKKKILTFIQMQSLWQYRIFCVRTMTSLHEPTV